MRLTAEDADAGVEETSGDDRGRWRRPQIVALAWLAPLFRPEGAALTLMAAVALLLGRGIRNRPLRARLSFAALVSGGAALPTLLLLATTGQATSSTAQVKLLTGDPYLGTRGLLDAIGDNVVLAVTSLLDGGVYSAEFLPAHGALLLGTGLVAVAIASRLPARQAKAHGWLVLGLAALLFVPCAYVTFLWNRLRYLWPFATGWIVGIACLAALVSQTTVQLLPVDLRWPRLSPLLTAALLSVALFLVARHLPLAVDDVADSASGIDRQQASLGRWVKANLPPDERVGVNDTGAIAYFGEHRTFDVVGLTTPGEGRYWVGGPCLALRALRAAGARRSGRRGELARRLRRLPAAGSACRSLLGAPLATREVPREHPRRDGDVRLPRRSRRRSARASCPGRCRRGSTVIFDQRWTSRTWRARALTGYARARRHARRAR